MFLDTSFAAEKVLEAYINGEFVESGAYFDNINPVDGSLVSRVTESGLEHVDKVVDAAQKALCSEWGAMT